MKNMKNKILKPILLSVVLIICIMIHNVFGIFIETTTGNFYSFIYAGVLIGIAALLIFSLVQMIVNKKHMYFVLTISTIIGINLVLFQTFRSVGIDIEYKMHLKGRQEIVKMFEEGKLKYDEFTMYVGLPKGYKNLSRFDGEVMVETRNKQLKLGFVATNSRFRKEEVIIVYSREKALYVDDFGTRLTSARKMDDNWYQITAEVLK